MVAGFTDQTFTCLCKCIIMKTITIYFSDTQRNEIVVKANLVPINKRSIVNMYYKIMKNSVLSLELFQKSISSGLKFTLRMRHYFLCNLPVMHTLAAPIAFAVRKQQSPMGPEIDNKFMYVNRMTFDGGGNLIFLGLKL